MDITFNLNDSTISPFKKCCQNPCYTGLNHPVQIFKLVLNSIMT